MMLSQSARAFVKYRCRLRQPAPCNLGPSRSGLIRGFHAQPTVWARVSSQDKDSINREPTEYTRSGTDEEVAEQDRAAFDPSVTSPGKEHEESAAGTGVGPTPDPLHLRMTLNQ